RSAANATGSTGGRSGRPEAVRTGAGAATGSGAAGTAATTISAVAGAGAGSGTAAGGASATSGAGKPTGSGAGTGAGVSVTDTVAAVDVTLASTGAAGASAPCSRALMVSPFCMTWPVAAARKKVVPTVIALRLICMVVSPRFPSRLARDRGRGMAARRRRETVGPKDRYPILVTKRSALQDGGVAGRLGARPP